jgi:seryl-tRNA synthetase
MHDIKAVRDNRDAFVAALARRPAYRDSAGAEADKLLAKDKELRELLVRLQTDQARRNEASKLIGQAKAKKDEAQAAALMAEVAGLKDAIQQGEAQQRTLEVELRDLLAVLPNLPAADAPDGAAESDNVPMPQRAFRTPRGINNAKQHFEIGEALGQMDFERAAKVSGARFVYLKADLAKLERAIAAFMLDTHTEKFGYTEVSPPVLVRDQALFGTGQLPKFEADLFSALAIGPGSNDEETNYETPPEIVQEVEGDLARTADFLKKIDAERDPQMRLYLAAGEMAGLSSAHVDRYNDRWANALRERYFLIPTAEVPLTNYVAEEILAEAELPIRFTAYTPCFRAEAGAAGRDTRGMIRMHQFSKVELVSITTPDQSNAEHERMTDAAQEILKKLDLAHRVVTLCTGDMGFGARKTYDIEVWLPGQNAFREISSCSNCGDFQARRMNTRFKGADGKVKGMVHTLNGSGLAVGRTMVAILENYQQPDGSVAIPDVLRPYMGGKSKIG